MIHADAAETARESDEGRVAAAARHCSACHEIVVKGVISRTVVIVSALAGVADIVENHSLAPFLHPRPIDLGQRYVAPHFQVPTAAPA